MFDPTYPDIDKNDFKECDWKPMYGNVEEATPPNAQPRGKEVDLSCFLILIMLEKLSPAAREQVSVLSEHGAYRVVF